MIPVTQSRVGERGTCFRACIASILNLPERAVVDFDGPRRYYHDRRIGLDDYWANVEGWLAQRGLRYRRVPVDGARPMGWSTIEGVSPRGGLHACVAYDGELVHDPHPQDSTGRGLVEPRWYGLLEPVRSKTKDAQPTKLDELRKKEALAFRRVMKAFPSSQRQKELHEQWQAIRKEYLAERERSGAKDRADMLALRRNTERQGGPFFIQETTENGRERTVPVRNLSKAADASPAKIALLLAALLAWYKARKAEGRCDNYDLATYRPARRVFDSLPLNRYPMSRLLDALGIDIREYMRRDEAQKERLLRAAIEKLDAGAR